MSKHYCVFKAPVEVAKYGDMDHMVKGGIYKTLHHAMQRAESLLEVLFLIWIEEYDGDIDVLTKANMVQVHYV